MKKIFLAATITLFMSIGLFGQGTHILVKETESIFKLDGKTSDTLDANYLHYKIITIRDAGFYNYYIDVDVDSAGDGGGVTVALQGRINSLDDWATITTVSWTGEVDTVITFSNSVDYTTSQTGASNTEIHSGTSVISAFNVTADTTGLSGYFADTLAYPAQTTTFTDTVTIASQATTNTVTKGGIIWPELRVLFTGSDAAADISLDDIVGIINRKK